MKNETRIIKASFAAGVSEWIFRLICEWGFNYGPLWIKTLGALGTGMILYSFAHSYYYHKEVKNGKL